MKTSLIVLRKKFPVCLYAFLTVHRRNFPRGEEKCHGLAEIKEHLKMCFACGVCTHAFLCICVCVCVHGVCVGVGVCGVCVCVVCVCVCVCCVVCLCVCGVCLCVCERERERACVA